MIITDNKIPVKSKGFSILESIIALTIMSISLIAIFSALRSASNAIHHKTMETKAVLLAEDKLSEIKLGKLTSFESSSGKKGRFTWQVEILPTEIEVLALVKSKVTWLEKNTENQVSLNTFVQMQNIMD